MVWSITNEQHWPALEKLHGAPRSETGQHVSIDTALALPAFKDGIELISSKIAATDCFTYRRLDDGSQEKHRTHPSYDILTQSPHPHSTPFCFFQALVSSAIWSGDGYALIEREEGTFEPKALHNLDSRDVYVVQEFTENKLTNLYYGFNGPTQVLVPYDDMVHVKSLSMHRGTTGIGVVNALRNVLGLNYAQYQFSSMFFKHGSHITKVLKIPGWLSQTQRDEVREELKHLHEGVSNAGRLSILMGGTELESLPISAEDFQLIQGLEMSVSDIASMLGLPASKLNGRNAAVSYGSLAEDNLAVFSDCYDARWFCNIEQELTKKLISPSERQDTWIEFERLSLFRGDPSQTDRIIKEFAASAISWPEMRQLLNRTTDPKKAGFDVLPSDARPAPVAPAPEAPATAPARPDESEDDSLARGLIERQLERMQTRILRAVESGKTDLSEHEEIIRSNLAPYDCSPITRSLSDIQQELDSVLPEQRAGVIQRWNIKQLSRQILRS